MLNAERSFRRLKGYRQMPTPLAALAHHLQLFHRHAMLHESLSGRTDAPPPSGRDSKLDARDDLGPKS